MKHVISILSAVILAVSILSSQTTVKMPPSTVVVVQSKSQLSSAKLKTGQQVVLYVATDVLVKGKKVIKANTPVFCIIEDAESAGMVGQGGRLTISIQSTTTVDGSTVALTGNFFTKGESKVGTSVAVGVILCPLALLCKGDDGDIPAGAQSRAFTIGEYEVNVSE